jgi:hypothetical protein
MSVTGRDVVFPRATTLPGRTMWRRHGEHGANARCRNGPAITGTWRLRDIARNGREVQRTLRGSWTEAARELRRLIAKEQESPEQADPNRTIGDVLDAWLAYGRTVTGRLWSPKTASENRLMVESRIRPMLGAIKLADLTVGDLEHTYAGWQIGENGWSNPFTPYLEYRTASSGRSCDCASRSTSSDPASGFATALATKVLHGKRRSSVPVTNRATIQNKVR